MERVPYKVEDGNFVGEEFDRKQQPASCNHRPITQELKLGGKIQNSGPAKDAQGGNRRIDVQAGREAYRGNQSSQVMGRKFHGAVIGLTREHWRNRKGRHKATLALRNRLQGGLDLESPSLEQRLRDVLRILVPARPLPQASRTQVLIG